VIPASVVAEVGYLLAAKAGPHAEVAFLRSLSAGDFPDLAADDYVRMADLIERYGNLPLGTTDAAVAAVAERLQFGEVVTLDRRDFTVVRPSARHRVHAAAMTTHTTAPRG
jgi:uncharacterized protein